MTINFVAPGSTHTIKGMARLESAEFIHSITALWLKTPEICAVVDTFLFMPPQKDCGIEQCFIVLMSKQPILVIGGVVWLSAKMVIRKFAAPT